jgi:hypothetical protein
MSGTIRGILGLAVLSFAPIAWGNDIASENYGAIALDQNNALVTAPYSTNGCAPTAATMGFQWLQSQYGIQNLVDGTNAYNTIVTVGNGTYMKTHPQFATSGPNMFAGAQAYLNAQAPGITTTVAQVDPFVGGATAPTENFIFNKLASGWAVQMGALWVPAGNPAANFKGLGGHALTVTGINWDPTTSTGSMDIIDPGGGTTVHGSLSLVTYTGVTQAGWNKTWLQFTYPNVAVGAPGDGLEADESTDQDSSGLIQDFGAAPGATMDIAVVVAEIPEPASFTLMAGIVGVGLLRRRRAL